MSHRTQVAIIGAGPAGLMLAHMLHLHNISTVILESRDREYALGRIRAGILEQGTVDILNSAGLGTRLKQEGMPHHGIDFAFAGEKHLIDVQKLCGKQVTVYGQTEIVRDLAEARDSYHGETLFEAEVTAIENPDSSPAIVSYRQNGKDQTLQADFIAACDGFHGIGRRSIPTKVLKTYDNEYPYSWLGILAKAPPHNDVVIYANHENGFALASMRSPDVTRLYLQVENDDSVDNWSDQQIWDALDERLLGDQYAQVNRGEILQKGITPMRSFVAEPMSYRRLYLAGDAAHIVPPTGAKGLNLAIADSAILASALINHYTKDDDHILKHYSDICLQRVWKVERFSWWCTTALHRNYKESEFNQKIHLAELDLLVTSETFARSFAENYTGLPIAHIPDF